MSIAKWNLKKAAGKLPVRGTRTASEANGSKARGRIDPKPNGIRIEPAYSYPMTYEYEVQFGRMEPDGLGSEKLVYHRDKSGITDIPHAAVAFTGAQPGRWRVRAKNSRGTSAWTEWWGFEFDR